MRTGGPRAVVALLAMILWFSTDLAPAGLASPPVKGSSTVSQTMSVGAQDVATQEAGGVAPLLSPDELRLSIDVTQKQLRVATGEYQQLERDLSLATSATEELRDEASTVAEETLHNAIEGYRHSEIPKGLLGADDVNSSMRATALGGAAVSSDTESFDAYRTLRKDLEIEESGLLERVTLVTTAEVEVDRLEDRLTGELIRFGDLEERRIQNEAIELSIQATNRSQARGRKQGFYLDTCPVNGEHSFIDSWGFARSGGRRHKGVDMLARTGTELVAPVSGTVEHYSNSVGGRSFRIFGDDGNYFYGTHLSGFAKQGQVNAGEVIGYVGDDGNAAGIPHLHFEIRPGGRSAAAINPYIDVSAVCNGAG